MRKPGQSIGWVIFLVAIGAVVFSVAWASRGAAASRTEAAAESLRKMGEQGVDQSPVATVNGVAIPRTTLEVHVATADLLGLGTATRRELLQDLVDSELLRQAAVEAGIQVSDDEVDAAIRAGLVDPLRGQLPLDLRQLLEAGLKAQGVTAESALDDARVRSAYAGLVLRGRYLQKLGKSASEVLPELRSRASIVIIDQDSIAPVRGKP